MNIVPAYQYYSSFIYQPAKIDLLKQYNFSTAGAISSVDWELFGAILTDQQKVSQGPDLKHYEVKSAIEKASFEYQYHLYGGSEKFKQDLTANQVFICYASGYANVEVRMAPGEVFKDYFEKWEEEYHGAIKSGVRFRRSIPYKRMMESTDLVLRIINGNLNEN